MPAGRRRSQEMQMEGNLIKLRNIERSYKLGTGQFFVLRRITMDVNEGDFITVMGPSGAGKSTLLNILGMLDGTHLIFLYYDLLVFQG